MILENQDIMSSKNAELVDSVEVDIKQKSPPSNSMFSVRRLITKLKMQSNTLLIVMCLTSVGVVCAWGYTEFYLKRQRSDEITKNVHIDRMKIPKYRKQHMQHRQNPQKHTNSWWDSDDKFDINDDNGVNWDKIVDNYDDWDWNDLMDTESDIDKACHRGNYL